MSTSGQLDTLIILASDQAIFYEFLKPRQEARGGTLVLLDRRRPNGTPGSPSHERRTTTPEAALALMSVLGFMVLHRHGDAWSA